MTRVIYFIPTVADVTTEDFDRSLQTSSVSTRYSDDGLKCILKFYEGNEPFDFVTKGYGPYTYEEIVEFLEGNSSWDGEGLL